MKLVNPKSYLALFGVVLFSTFAVGCETVEGVGEDIEELGDEIEDEATTPPLTSLSGRRAQHVVHGIDVLSGCVDRRRAGITGIAGLSAQIAWILFVVGLILAVVSFVFGRRGRI